MNVKPYDDDISPVKIFFPRSLSRLPCVKPTVVFNLAKNLHFKILSIYFHPFRYTFFREGLEIDRSYLIENPNVVIPPMLGIVLT